MSTVVDDLKAQADKAVTAAANALEAQAAAQAAATSSKLQAAALALKSDANQELVAVKGRLNTELAKKPKTVLFVALIIGFIAGMLFASFAGKVPVDTSASKGATASHEAYEKPARKAEWREFVPFNDGGSAGRG